MGTSLGPKYIPYTYTDPLGKSNSEGKSRVGFVLKVLEKEDHWECMTTP